MNKIPEDMILDRTRQPSPDEIAECFSEDVKPLWLEMISFIETDFRAKQQIHFSVCAGKPGWNVKYKKSGKALCTLYPEKDRFIALVVLGKKDLIRFEPVRDSYTREITELYDGCSLFNGTKWMMIPVNNSRMLDEVKRLIKIKVAKG